MLFHYFIVKFQAVKPITNHTRWFIRAVKPEGSGDAAEELSPPEVNTGLTIPACLSWQRKSQSHSTSLEDESRVSIRANWTPAPRTSATSAASGTNPKSACST